MQTGSKEACDFKVICYKQTNLQEAKSYTSLSKLFCYIQTGRVRSFQAFLIKNKIKDFIFRGITKE